MKTLSLNGAWQLCQAGENMPVYPARVPGSVYHDLLTCGAMEDPFYRDNEMKALALMENDYVYSRRFDVPEAFLTGDRVLLRAEGLDTLADITVNGQPVGRADNMHRIWEFDVKNVLRAGENEIRVLFHSPTKFIREAYEKSPMDGSSDAMVGFPLLRKAHCMFGWDWGPRLPDMGIWRDIKLLRIDSARIGDVYVTQTHENGRVICHVRTRLEQWSGENLRIQATITAPDGKVFSGEGADCDIEIADPRLWWPSGYGEQPLYTVAVFLRDEAAELDSWQRRIGLRTLTVKREKDQWGESFCHRVNGVDIFAMGADYIPEDNLLPRVNPERSRRLLSDAKAAHINMIRVWGGGYYPDDFFYDLCDELGLLVWQDFMFACAVYDLTPAFEQNIRAEFVDNIRRLRHHASLALWCGNNEMEMFVDRGLWVTRKKQAADYIKMYEYILPQVLGQEDPQTFYWPASPSSGGSFDEPNDENRGDVHYWDVWHGRKPFTDYRNYHFRYASEFGFQAFPCMETIRSFTLPEDRNVYSYVMEKHQRNASANGVLASYLSQTYLYPSTLELFVYASQLLQGQAIQYGVEHWRRNRGRCMGAVIWQLNDCWPVISWASIDYYGRWKALHYYAKRFFSPVLISCKEEGVLSQNSNVNAEPFSLKKAAQLNVSNETMQPFAGTARWSLRRPDASVIVEGAFPVQVPALSAIWLPEQDFSDQDTYGCYYAYSLEDAEGNPVGEGTVLFCAPKHFHFADPGLTARLEGDTVVVRASAYARSVEIDCGADVVLEDNYFDMNGGERRVRVLRGEPKEPAVRSVYDIR